MPIKLLIADDHQVISESLTPMLNSQPDIEVIAEVNNGRAAVETAIQLRPDIVIMDIAMPELNGIEATRQIIAQFPEVKVIILSMHADRRYVIGALEAGAAGYLTKSCSFKELVVAVKNIYENKKYLSPEISSIVIEKSLGRFKENISTVAATLTKREREVLQLLAEGKTIKESAFELKVSIKTVHTHRTKIMQKLKINNMASLIKYALQEGLISLTS
jgi:two-component system, NarL family, response regulator NreC